MVMVLGTICLISLATFIFFSSPQKLTVGVKDHHLLRREGLQSKTLQQLALHVKQLEEAVAKYSGSKTGDEKGNEDPSAIDHMAAYKAPQHNANPSDQLKRSDQPVSSMVSVSIKDTLDDAVTSQWLSRLASKLLCMRLRSGGIYHYHTRKAAGTSIRDILTKIAATWHVRYYETEGIVLNREIIDKKTGLLTVTSLREPIARILSLYWYEHVGWYDGVLKQTERCKSLKEWVSAWRDGSPWKTQFMSKNPDSVYVEIDNYYVKMLTGWHPRNSRSRVNADDLEAAKAVLRSFDLVLLSDWMGDSTQVEAMNAVFPGNSRLCASVHCMDEITTCFLLVSLTLNLLRVVRLFLCLLSKKVFCK